MLKHVSAPLNTQRRALEHQTKPNLERFQLNFLLKTIWQDKCSESLSINQKEKWKNKNKSLKVKIKQRTQNSQCLPQIQKTEGVFGWAVRTKPKINTDQSVWNKAEAQIFYRLVLKNTKRKRRWKSKRGWHWQIQGGQIKEQTLMKGGAPDPSDKVKKVHQNITQIYTPNKEINAPLYYFNGILLSSVVSWQALTSTLGEGRPFKGSLGIHNPLLSVSEVVNEPVAAVEAVSTWKAPRLRAREWVCVTADTSQQAAQVKDSRLISLLTTNQYSRKVS